MKKNVLTTMIALLTVVSSGIAQEEIVIIEQNTRAKRAQKTIRLNDNTSVIKFTPTQLLVGEINFSFEKQLNRYTSLEIGAGPTISNVQLGSGVGNHYVDPYYGGYALQTSGLGFFAEAGYRFYPLDETEALNRFYLSPIVKFRLMNFGLEDASQVLPDNKGNNMLTSFAFNVGYQLWLSKSFSLDFFSGLGIGYQQDKNYQVFSSYDGLTGEYTSEWKDISSSYARFVFNFGVKVGIGQK